MPGRIRRSTKHIENRKNLFIPIYRGTLFKEEKDSWNSGRKMDVSSRLLWLAEFVGGKTGWLRRFLGVKWVISVQVCESCVSLKFVQQDTYSVAFSRVKIVRVEFCMLQFLSSKDTFDKRYQILIIYVEISGLRLLRRGIISCLRFFCYCASKLSSIIGRRSAKRFVRVVNIRSLTQVIF